MPASHLERVDDWVPAELLDALRDVAADQSVHLVGGAVRDQLLGRAAPDLDLVANGRADALGRRLAQRLGGRFVALAGERFAAYRVVTADLVIDLWGRGDTPIRAELERRDLTINAIAIDLAKRRLLDPFDGIGDLERRLLRVTSARSFVEDPLRVVRLARFAAELDGFTADPPTVELARRAAPDVTAVAAERIREEVGKTLATRGRARGVEILVGCGLYPRLWGGRGEAAPATVAPRLAAIEATREAVLAEAGPGLGECDPIAVAQALLFSPPGGDATAVGASSLLTRRNRSRVALLLALEALPTDELEARWFLREWRRRWCEAAVFCILRRPLDRTKASEAAVMLARLVRHRGREIFELEPLLDGDEVGSLLGLAAGPEIGRALAALEREQVAGRVRTPAEAQDFLTAERSREKARRRR